MAADRSEDEMWGVAFQLAVSSRYPDCDAVVKELRSRGYRFVDKITKSKFACEQITTMCQNARRAKENEKRQPRGK